MSSPIRLVALISGERVSHFARALSLPGWNSAPLLVDKVTRARALYIAHNRCVQLMYTLTVLCSLCVNASISL